MKDTHSSCSVPCNLCGLREVEEVSDIDRDGEYLRTVICKNCGLVWSDPRPNEGEVRDFYTKNYRIAYKGTYAPRLIHVHRAGNIAEQRYLFLKEILRDADEILDVGAGGGEFVYFMRKLGYAARGIEPNEGYGNYARTELALPIEVGFVQQFDLADDSLDVVTMHHVFEHLDDPLLILSRLHRALRPDGFLVIEVPNVEAKCSAPKNRFHKAHLYNFNLATLEAMGRKGGFSPIKSVTSNDGGVITVIFQRSNDSDGFSGQIEANYEKIIKILKSHSAFSHYLTPYPYLRPFQKLKMHSRERSATKSKTGGKGVLDEIVSKYQTGQNVDQMSQ